MPSRADHRGKFIIVLIFGVALAMSGYAWWHQYRAGRQSAEFWGLPAMRTIKRAAVVEYIPLLPPTSESPELATIDLPGGSFRRGEPIDVSQSRGLIHARHALVDDLSYDWSDAGPAVVTGGFLLRFQEQGAVVTAALDLEAGVVHFVERDRSARLVPHIAAGFRKKQADWAAFGQD